MLVLSFIADGFVLALGSVLAAALFCWSSWTVFKVIRHPEWGPPLLLVAVVLWFGPAISSSAFLRPALMFAILAAALAWPQGKDWRTLRRERGPAMRPRLALAHLPVWHRRKTLAASPAMTAVPAIMDRPSVD